MPLSLGCMKAVLVTAAATLASRVRGSAYIYSRLYRWTSAFLLHDHVIGISKKCMHFKKKWSQIGIDLRQMFDQTLLKMYWFITRSYASMLFFLKGLVTPGHDKKILLIFKFLSLWTALLRHNLCWPLKLEERTRISYVSESSFESCRPRSKALGSSTTVFSVATQLCAAFFCACVICAQSNGKKPAVVIYVRFGRHIWHIWRTYICPCVRVEWMKECVLWLYWARNLSLGHVRKSRLLYFWLKW